MSDALLIAGAPAMTGLNGMYYMLNTDLTGIDRVWGNQPQMRVYYDNGWKFANSADGVVYFYQKEPSEIDPWDLQEGDLDTDIENYKDYVNSIGITWVEDKPIRNITVTTVKNYFMTEDVVFDPNKIYYTRLGAGEDDNPYIYTPAEVEPGEAIPADTYYEASETATTTTTVVDKHTNYSSTESSSQKVTIVPVVELHKRYSPPSLQAGRVYRFAFVRDFIKLGYISPQSDDWSESAESENDADITRGIFKVDEITTYYRMTLDGIDVFQNLYMPLGLPRSLFEQDRKKWMNDDVWYKLVNPMLPAQIYYIPTSIIEGIPDGNVAEYRRYQMLIDIGIFNDEELLSDIVTCVNMLMMAHFGIPTKAELTSYDSVWIPNKYYSWLEDQRKMNIEEFMSEKKSQYYNTLFINEYNTLEKENKILKTRVKTYEEILADMGK